MLKCIDMPHNTNSSIKRQLSKLLTHYVLTLSFLVKVNPPLNPDYKGQSRGETKGKKRSQNSMKKESNRPSRKKNTFY